MKCSLVAAALLASVGTYACTGFVVGKKASGTGFVIVAHNEDNFPGHVVRHAMIPRGAPFFNEPGRARIPQDGPTFACHWSEVTSHDGKSAPGDLFLNENGVMVYSNSGGVMEPWEKPAWLLPEEGHWSSCTDGGLGLNLRFAVAQRARTAAEGVSIMTNLVTTYGYFMTSRIFTIADKDEAWLVQVLKGRRYVARRCPDDAVVAYPNCLTIGRLEPGDICSPGIEARRAGGFDFAAFYQGPRTWKAPLNFHRGLDLYRIVAGVNATGAKDYPFSIRPAGKVTADDIKRGLRSHYEGTDYEVKPKHRKEAPELLEPVCRLLTRESMVCEFGAKPSDAVLHLATGRPCETPYEVCRPFGGKPAGDAATGEDALRRIREHFPRVP